MKKIFLLNLIMLGYSCSSSNKDEKISTFDRKDIPEIISLSQPDTIQIEEALDPLEFFLVKDSLIVISNKNASSTYKSGVYSLNNRKLIKEIAPKGNGPKEFISCTLDIRENNSDIFYIEDVIQNKYWKCSMDSILSGSDYLLENFRYSREVIRLCPLDSSYIGYNFWYINHTKYDNKIPQLNRYSKNVNSIKRTEDTNYNYFVANVTGGYVFMNQSKKCIWVTDFFDDRIYIYDDSLKLSKCIWGPDHIEPQLISINKNNYNYIFFEKGTSYRGYLAYTTTEKHIYLVYEGTNGTPYRTTDLQPVEVFKFDWDGNLLSTYKLDKYIYTISVDSHEEFLYGTSCNSYEGEVTFIKYPLK